VHLHVRIIAATLLLAVLAISTGTVLLLGYLLAAFSIGAIIFIMTRKMIKRIANARLARVRLVPQSSAVTSHPNDETQRLAA
jgi:membrane protein implicated in regulation of membrane protease activity